MTAIQALEKKNTMGFIQTVKFVIYSQHHIAKAEGLIQEVNWLWQCGKNLEKFLFFHPCNFYFFVSRYLHYSLIKQILCGWTLGTGFEKLAQGSDGQLPPWELEPACAWWQGAAANECKFLPDEPCHSPVFSEWTWFEI